MPKLKMAMVFRQGSLVNGQIGPIFGIESFFLFFHSIFEDLYRIWA
eukprot:UN07345